VGHSREARTRHDKTRPDVGSTPLSINSMDADHTG